MLWQEKFECMMLFRKFTGFNDCSVCTGSCEAFSIVEVINLSSKLISGSFMLRI